MHFNARGGLSIIELVVYLPSLVVAAFVCSRHGFSRSSGWLYTLILCLVRIVGACCQLATYHSETRGLWEATIILDTIGLSPLLLATLGLLSRCVDSINVTSKSVLTVLHFRVIQLLITIGLILSIAGGTSSVSSTGVYKVQTTSEVGIVLFVVAYIALVVVTFVTLGNMSHLPSREERVVWAVIISMPLILIRLIYSALRVFHHDSTFNIISGSVLALGLMSVVEEIVVVLIYLLVGCITDPVARTAERPIANRPWKGRLSGDHGVQSGHRGARGGPIHRLVGVAVAAAQEHKGNGDAV